MVGFVTDLSVSSRPSDALTRSFPVTFLLLYRVAT